MPGDEVISDSLQPFLFEVWHWLPHMPRHCENTLRANSTITAIIAVREVKSFEVGRERVMLREEDNILSNPVSGTEANWRAWCYRFSCLYCHSSMRFATLQARSSEGGLLWHGRIHVDRQAA
ncbi:hypothetical protein AVEN_226877-1 [Araneus ventricosus]|uniref:Uncharacterized protein n=1 Tax=Araneus ventricosus TaxID=182803 RepID=A0A4Y2H9C9_ARAVE|nr:hypothetical protein AVEN_226877-1 [Araneus ventricosus]